MLKCEKLLPRKQKLNKNYQKMNDTHWTNGKWLKNSKHKNNFERNQAAKNEERRAFGTRFEWRPIASRIDRSWGTAWLSLFFSLALASDCKTKKNVYPCTHMSDTISTLLLSVRASSEYH